MDELGARVEKALEVMRENNAKCEMRGSGGYGKDMLACSDELASLLDTLADLGERFELRVERLSEGIVAYVMLKEGAKRDVAEIVVGDIVSLGYEDEPEYIAKIRKANPGKIWKEEGYVSAVGFVRIVLQ